MSGTGFRKGNRLYSPLCGFATVVDGSTKDHWWGGELVGPGRAIVVKTDNDQERFVWTNTSLKLTPQTEALLGGLSGIHFRFQEIAVEMLRQEKPVREIEDLFKAAVVVIDVARNTGR